MKKTKVIFKMFHGEVLALFPGIIESKPGHRERILSYMHVGQHSPADKVLQYELQDADPEQYQDLYNELTNVIGYDLDVWNEEHEEHILNNSDIDIVQ